MPVARLFSELLREPLHLCRLRAVVVRTLIDQGSLKAKPTPNGSNGDNESPKHAKDEAQGPPTPETGSTARGEVLIVDRADITKRPKTTSAGRGRGHIGMPVAGGDCHGSHPVRLGR